MCGLIQSIFESVPVTATRFCMSKIAVGEWWAWRDATPRRMKTRLPTGKTVCLTTVRLQRRTNIACGRAARLRRFDRQGTSHTEQLVPERLTGGQSTRDAIRPEAFVG